MAEFELRGHLILGIESVAEEYSSQSARRVDLNPSRLLVVRPVGLLAKVAEVELHLVPAICQY